MSKLESLLSRRGALLADGAFGTNLFDMGLVSGDAPELWNTDEPEKIKALHRSFVQAGADIILTNTFGCNRHRLKLHAAEERVNELNSLGVQLAREVCEETDREILIAGSIGPTGELFQPLGALSYQEGVEAFREQIEGLRDGGADILWAETMSAVEEMKAVAEAASEFDLPLVITASFDTAGKTMMGLAPANLGELQNQFACTPAAIGSNCGVGASDLLAAILEITDAYPDAIVVAKANCGIPQIQGDEVVYTGTPELMAKYAHMAMDVGARIIGGCCGTSPSHLAAMRRALDDHKPGPRPTLETMISEIGPLVSPPNKKADAARAESEAAGVGRRRGRRRS
ncbi:betaine--homocysteine S-methyltransferase [Roseibium porphyridii]|uniref:Betaine--homocysteine S-methyltransferase n=1 Tax=Roseibium porphyridii TaxID=2866279 RepID=A0ABY8F3E0_9HYPH|nr:MULTISPECIES: betaine--homocysteine S-methyltransferase [Stappiaceae]QFT32512.1 Bifunctional homocysteine S-methyltransferase/5,10-methylenetetrahydrofolate reductase [Labrenzia sp. THAF82]WFE87845.1 betaine--homocysteine S-methyltransferase [Roseibium sp. KMA01]